MRTLLPLLFLAVAACQHGGQTAGDPSQYVLRVDQRLDRAADVTPSDPPAESSFRPVDPIDAYSIAIDGDAVTITSLDGSSKKIGGHRDKGEAGEERFTLETGVFAGGRLVLRGTRAELTIYGSGVPIVSSDRGALVRR